MILAVDVGNSNILMGGIENGRLCFTSRCSSDLNKTEDEYLLLLRSLLTAYEVAPEELEGGILSSVVPALRDTVHRAMERLIGRRVLMVGAGLKTGLNIRIDDPGQLGSDLVVNAVAAAARYPLPAVVFDLGTATTMSVLDARGAYVGGAIAPGLRVSVDALSDAAAQLPHIMLDLPERLIQANTVECMQSGAVYGWACMLDGLAGRVEKELGAPVTVIVTGGAGRHVLPYCTREMVVDENLLLSGLGILYEKNQPSVKKKQK